MTRFDGSAPAPPAALEDRIVALLVAESLLAPPVPAWPVRAMQRYAAAILLMLAGAAAGHWGPALVATDTGGRDYLILLYQGTGLVEANVSADTTRASEYGEWARRIDALPEISVTAGNELSGQNWLLGPINRGEPHSPVGYFIVRAQSDEAARRIAATAPHLKYGGTLTLSATQ